MRPAVGELAGRKCFPVARPMPDSRDRENAPAAFGETPLGVHKRPAVLSHRPAGLFFALHRLGATLAIGGEPDGAQDQARQKVGCISPGGVAASSRETLCERQSARHIRDYRECHAGNQGDPHARRGCSHRRRSCCPAQSNQVTTGKRTGGLPIGLLH